MLCDKGAEAQVEGMLSPYRVNSGVHERAGKDEAEEVSKVIFTVCSNTVKSGVPVPTSK